VQQNQPSTNRRRAERRSLKRVVSFSCLDEKGRSDWYLGTIRDAGLGGIKIQSNRAVALHRGQRLSILCVPEGSRPGNGQEAVQMHGQVVWQDMGSYCFGLEYI